RRLRGHERCGPASPSTSPSWPAKDTRSPRNSPEGEAIPRGALVRLRRPAGEQGLEPAAVEVPGSRLNQAADATSPGVLIHAFAQINQNLVRLIDPNKSDPWILNIQNHVYSHCQSE